MRLNKLFMAAILLASGACSQVSGDTNADNRAITERATVSSERKVLVLWVTELAGSALGKSGHIPGKLKTTAPPEISATVLADRLLRCGVTTYTFRADSHVEYVFTDSTDKDSDLVRCVQEKVDFGFSAGVSTPEKLEEADPSAFKAFHA